MLTCPLAVPLLPPGMSPHCQSPEMPGSFLLLPLALPGTVLWPVALCEDGTRLPIALHSALLGHIPLWVPRACLPGSCQHPPHLEAERESLLLALPPQSTRHRGT